MGRAGLKVVEKTEVERSAPESMEPGVVLEPHECRQHLHDRIVERFPGIVDGFLKKAEEGSAQHVKMALELVDPAEKKAAEKYEKGSAQLLMEELGLE